MAFWLRLLIWLGITTLPLCAAGPRRFAASGFQVHGGRGLQYSADGRWLVASLRGPHDNARIRIWDTETGKVDADWASPEGPIGTLAVARRADVFLTGHEDTILRWQLGPPWSAAPQELPTVREWIATRRASQTTERVASQRVHALALSPEADRCAWCWDDQPVQFGEWAAAPRPLDARLMFTTYGGNLHFVSSTLLLGVPGPGRDAVRWNLLTGEEKRVLLSKDALVIHVAPSLSGRVFAGIVNRSERADELWLWQAGTRAVRLGRGPHPLLFGPAISSDGQWVAVGAYANRGASIAKIAFWHVGTRRPAGVLDLPSPGACPAYLAFAPDGKTLAVGSFFDRTAIYLFPLPKPFHVSSSAASKNAVRAEGAPDD